MTLLLTSRNERDDANYALQKVFETFLYPNIPQQLRDQTAQHLAWMSSRPKMYINAKVETSDHLQLTRITLEISHRQLPSLRQE